MGYEDTGDTKIHGMICVIHGIRGYVGYMGYKDTGDTRIHGMIRGIQVIRVYVGYVGYEDTGDTRIRGIQGCMGYEDTGDTRIRGYEDTGDTRIRGYVDTRIRGYEDTGDTRDTRTQEKNLHNTTVALLNSQSFWEHCKLFTTVVIPKCIKIQQKHTIRVVNESLLMVISSLYLISQPLHNRFTTVVFNNNAFAMTQRLGRNTTVASGTIFVVP